MPSSCPCWRRSARFHPQQGRTDTSFCIRAVRLAENEVAAGCGHADAAESREERDKGNKHGGRWFTHGRVPFARSVWLEALSIRPFETAVKVSTKRSSRLPG